MKITYKKSGVNIDKGEQLVEWLKQTKPSNEPHSDSLIDGIGGFASLFRLPIESMESPCLVACTDGVGTKLKLAVEFDSYSSIGQDLVAMCINDMICCGAKPLFFLDYFATGQLDLEQAKAFLTGVREACMACHCLLIGGETAEMPGIYSGKDFDCAGFAVGLIDESKALGKNKVCIGDRVLGVSSSGFHSNGYSLLRNVLKDELHEWKEVLLRPTSLYYSLFEKLNKQVDLHALANITGGGEDNVLRVIPDGLAWKKNQWLIPEIFKKVGLKAGLSDKELLKILNCGIGLSIFVAESDFEKTQELIEINGFKAYDIGKVVEGKSEQKPFIFE